MRTRKTKAARQGEEATTEGKQLRIDKALYKKALDGDVAAMESLNESIRKARHIIAVAPQLAEAYKTEAEALLAAADLALTQQQTDWKLKEGSQKNAGKYITGKARHEFALEKIKEDVRWQGERLARDKENWQKTHKVKMAVENSLKSQETQQKIYDLLAQVGLANADQRQLQTETLRDSYLSGESPQRIALRRYAFADEVEENGNVFSRVFEKVTNFITGK